ncbi:unnamed protein product [Caenorhabditis auriculariae]|uniref:Coiled-coil domain-containing protein 86 n=1 Tax=Caenorhabditis auriculariae TaxID=2777116 RepID=A0A8S1GUD0_9PELO|nr:unnamed protein product [Caenorhabditis auriculariae]
MEEQQADNVVVKTADGPNKSGRWWKEKQTARHSSIVKVKPLKSTWDKKMSLKAKKNQVKLLQSSIRERKQQEKEEKIEARKEQEKRKLENERKNEIVQLRTVVKRDTN